MRFLCEQLYRRVLRESYARALQRTPRSRSIYLQKFSSQYSNTSRYSTYIIVHAQYLSFKF